MGVLEAPIMRNGGGDGCGMSITITQLGHQKILAHRHSHPVGRFINVNNQYALFFGGLLLWWARLLEGLFSSGPQK
jgi:hypothetical protein